MISAKIAREMTKKIVEKPKYKELKELEEEIKNTINEGKFGLFGNGNINEETKKTLVENGFSINIIANSNNSMEGCYFINW